jgi:L-asparaginase
MHQPAKNLGHGRIRPRITIFSTGGTIASVPSSNMAASPTLTAEQLIAAVPQLTDIADLTAIQFRQSPSSDLSLTDVCALALEIDQAVTKGADGIVVTQGTDTLEETSFALSLLYKGNVPVVLTGAMRNPAALGADGPANLFDAALVASSQDARGVRP